MSPFFKSYNRTVRDGNMNELARTVYAWQDQYFNFPQSRAVFTRSLTQLAKDTSILNDPENLAEESVEAAISCTNEESAQEPI